MCKGFDMLCGIFNVEQQSVIPNREQILKVTSVFKILLSYSGSVCVCVQGVRDITLQGRKHSLCIYVKLVAQRLFMEIFMINLLQCGIVSPVPPLVL